MTCTHDFAILVFLQTLAAQSSTDHPRSPGPGTPGASGTSLSTRSNDGWDTEEWGSLDEAPVSVFMFCSLGELIDQFKLYVCIKYIKHLKLVFLMFCLKGAEQP